MTLTATSGDTTGGTGTLLGLILSLGGDSFTLAENWLKRATRAFLAFVAIRPTMSRGCSGR